MTFKAMKVYIKNALGYTRLLGYRNWVSDGSAECRETSECEKRNLWHCGFLRPLVAELSGWLYVKVWRLHMRRCSLVKGKCGALGEGVFFCFVASSHRRGGGVGSNRQLEASLHHLEAFEKDLCPLWLSERVGSKLILSSLERGAQRRKCKKPFWSPFKLMWATKVNSLQ